MRLDFHCPGSVKGKTRPRNGALNFEDEARMRCRPQTALSQFFFFLATHRRLLLANHNSLDSFKYERCTFHTTPRLPPPTSAPAASLGYDQTFEAWTTWHCRIFCCQLNFTDFASSLERSSCARLAAPNCLLLFGEPVRKSRPKHRKAERPSEGRKKKKKQIAFCFPSSIFVWARHGLFSRIF